MTFYAEPIPLAASGTRWMPTDQAHEFLYSQWIFGAHSRGHRFDFHLPECTTSLDEIADVLRTYLKLVCVDELSHVVDYFPAAKLKTPSDKWHMYSGMQKAIRRSDYTVALRCAATLLNSNDGSAMWRRLAVTGLEDLGLSSPYLVTLVCLAASSKAFRHEVGEKQLLMFLVANMCSAPKSRDLNDLLYMDKDGSHKEAVHVVQNYTQEGRIDCAASPSAPFALRYVSYASMFGMHSVEERDFGLVFATHEKLGLPPLFTLLMQVAFRTTGAPFCSSIPFIYELMLSSPTIGTTADPYLPGVSNGMLHGIHSASFDKHTYLGKAAAKKFYAKCTAIRNALDGFGVPPVKHMGALERAIFYVEGAVLDPRLQYDGAESLYYDVLTVKLLNDNGFKSLKDGLAFYVLVRKNIWMLREIRAACG